METNLCVAGFGGQGVMTLGKFLASATCDSTDKNVTFFPSYGAEQRGGTANCFVVISCTPYGINTHRLVVTGERTDETASEHKTEDRVRSTWRHAYLKALLLGFGIAGGAGVMIRILSRHRQKVREQ